MKINAPRKHATLSILALALAAQSVAFGATSTFTDDFSDNAIGSQWKFVPDDAGTLTLNETNQQLQAVANNPDSSHTDAIYLSNGPTGFRVSTSQDFDITISYKFIPPATATSFDDAMGLDLGVGTDAGGFNSVAVGFGYTFKNVLGGIMAPGLAVESRVGNTPTDNADPELGSTGIGTLEVKYDAGTDVFTLSNGVNTETRTGLIADWGNPDSLLVSFGARGSGFTFNGTNAWLDNFSVTGDILTPEPTALALLLPAGLTLVARRRRGQSSPIA